MVPNVHEKPITRRFSSGQEYKWVTGDWKYIQHPGVRIRASCNIS